MDTGHLSPPPLNTGLLTLPKAQAPEGGVGLRLATALGAGHPPSPARGQPQGRGALVANGLGSYTGCHRPRVGYI